MARVGALITPFVAQVTQVDQFSHLNTSQHNNDDYLFVTGLHLAGDVGVICVPGSLRVLLLLPPRRRRLLCAAN